MKKTNFIFALILLLCIISSCKNHSDTNTKKIDSYNRIISLSPHITEFIYAIGEGDKLIARTNFCNYPTEAKKLPVIGDALKLNVELLLSLKPDIVLLLEYQTNHIEICKKYHINYIAVLDNRIDEILNGYNTILNKVFRNNKKGITLINQLKEITHKNRIDIANKLNVLVIVDHYPLKLNGIFAVGSNNWMNDLIEISGASNVLKTNPLQYPQISIEEIINYNPDIIIDLLINKTLNEKEKLIYKELWSSLNMVNAVANNKIFTYHDQYFSIPGPRLAFIIKEWSKIFH